MTGAEKSRLTAKQERAALAIAVGSVEDAAAAVGVSERTVYRWLQLDAFNARVREHQREALGRVAAHLRGIALEGAAKLRAIIDDDKAPASARVSAYRVAVENALRFAELQDVHERLTRLEALAGGGR